MPKQVMLMERKSFNGIERMRSLRARLTTVSDFYAPWNTSPQLVFGAGLLELELSEMVPLFLVECVRIVEMPENLTTCGIYRASGKKESIDKLKEKMNKKKPSKGSKFRCLESEDVHTITGALKQFFRELKTTLIPNKLVKDLPINLGAEESIIAIRCAIEALEPHAKATVKYLVRHLVKVQENSVHNMMSASSLSIVWGACLFSTTLYQNHPLDTTDIDRKNTFVQTLLLRYTAIFGPDSTEG